MIDNLDLNGDFVESQAFAFLGIRSLLNLPISFPETTGCKEPSSGGVSVSNFQNTVVSFFMYFSKVLVKFFSDFEKK